MSWNNQVDNRLIRASNMSATWSHAQLICRSVIKKLRAFFGPRGQDRSQSPPGWTTLIFPGKTNTAIHSHTFTVSARPWLPSSHPSSGGAELFRWLLLAPPSGDPDHLGDITGEIAARGSRVDWACANHLGRPRDASPIPEINAASVSVFTSTLCSHN